MLGATYFSLRARLLGRASESTVITAVSSSRSRFFPLLGAIEGAATSVLSVDAEEGGGLDPDGALDSTDAGVDNRDFDALDDKKLSTSSRNMIDRLMNLWERDDGLMD